MGKLNKYFYCFLSFTFCYNSLTAQEDSYKSFGMVTIKNGTIGLNITNREPKGYIVALDTIIKLPSFKTNKVITETYITKANELLNICKLDYNITTSNSSIVISQNLIKYFQKKKEKGAFEAFKLQLEETLNYESTSIVSTSENELGSIFMWGNMPIENEMNTIIQKNKETETPILTQYFEEINTVLDGDKVFNGVDLMNTIDKSVLPNINKDLNINYLDNMGYVTNKHLNIGGGLTYAIISFIYPEKLFNDTISIHLEDLNHFINNLTHIDASNFELFKGSINLLAVDKKTRPHILKTQLIVKKLFTYNQFISGAVFLKKILALSSAENINVVYTNNALAEQIFGKTISEAKINYSNFVFSKK